MHGNVTTLWFCPVWQGDMTCYVQAHTALQRPAYYFHISNLCNVEHHMVHTT